LMINIGALSLALYNLNLKVISAFLPGPASMKRTFYERASTTLASTESSLKGADVNGEDDSKQAKEEEKTVQPAWKRKSTPGKNTYLKVILDDDTMDQLHELMGDMKRGFEALPTENCPEPQQDSSRGQTLKIRPRSKASLHVTFFFGGEVICELPTHELVDWHSALTERFRESGFSLSESGISDPGEHWLTFRHLSLFPLKRNYLVVALLDASPALEKLCDDIRLLALTSDSEGLREMAKRSKEKWTAHVTLANLRGPKKEIQSLQRFLSQRSVEDELQTKRIPASAISMGGPEPKQAELAWHFSG